MSLRFAYNTNGTANHRLDDAIDLIADAGYQGVALTLDIHHLDPFSENWTQEAQRLSSRLQRLGLGSVIETGARFLLDPKAKHEPTLVSGDASGRARRIGFLKRAVDIAVILHSEAVSFWAGVPKPASIVMRPGSGSARASPRLSPMLRSRVSSPAWSPSRAC